MIRRTKGIKRTKQVRAQIKKLKNMDDRLKPELGILLTS